MGSASATATSSCCIEPTFEGRCVAVASLVIATHLLDEAGRRRSLASGRALEGQRHLALERLEGRLEEHQHLGRGVEGKRLDAVGDGAEARDLTDR